MLLEKDVPYFDNFISRLHLDGQYDFIDYIGERFTAKTKVILSCKEHGKGSDFCNPWLPVADSVMQGYGCPKCSGKYKYTQAEYIDQLSVLGFKFINFIGEFRGIQTKVNLDCPIHGTGSTFGTPWNPTLVNVIYHRKGCPKCSNVYKRNQEEWIRIVNSSKYTFVRFDSEFKGKHTRIVVNCPYHGDSDMYKTKWIPRLEDILRGNGCPKCSYRYRYSEDEYRKELEATLPFTVLGFVSNKPINKHSIVNLSCPVHGNGRLFDNPWLPSINNILKGGNCPKCTKHYVYTELNIIEKIHSETEYYFVKFSIGFSNGVKSKVIVRCPNHDNDYQWETTPDALFCGRGCPSCNVGNGGFNQSKEAYFYLQDLFMNGELVAIKIGITNNDPIKRMKQQSSKSLLTHKLVDYIYSPNGSLIADFEKTTLEFVRNTGSSCFLSKELMPDGYTETVNPKYKKNILVKMAARNLEIN